MLIDVWAGDSSSAAAWGSFHFARSPQAGEEVEIDGTVVVVTRAWHRPSIYYKGAKFAITPTWRFEQTRRRAMSPFSALSQAASNSSAGPKNS